MAELANLRQAITDAQEVAIRARSTFERAEKDKAEAERALEELGLDINEDLDAQLARLRASAETATEQVIEKQKVVEEALS